MKALYNLLEVEELVEVKKAIHYGESGNCRVACSDNEVEGCDYYDCRYQVTQEHTQRIDGCFMIYRIRVHEQLFFSTLLNLNKQQSCNGNDNRSQDCLNVEENKSLESLSKE